MLIEAFESLLHKHEPVFKPSAVVFHFLCKVIGELVNCSLVTHHEKREIENCGHCKTKFWFIKR